MVLCKKPCKVTTVLGSCLAIILYHEKSQTGAICHALLPRCNQSSTHCQNACSQTFRFVDCSLQFMLDRFAALGVAAQELNVKLFGGADMFIARNQESISDVGRQNVEIATNLVQKFNLRLTAYSMGGMYGRKLFFFSQTGLVEMKYVNEKNPTAFSQIFQKEQQLLHREK